MRAKRIVFSAPGQVELADFELDLDNPAPGEVAIETAYSLISPGTELACLSGTETWAKMPFVPGYSSVGKVVRAGAGLAEINEGDIVFCYGPHQSHSKVGGLVMRVPEDVDPQLVPFARLATVAFTAVRVGAPELGDVAAVIGLGPVGNLAAQLLALSGCEVIGIDLSAPRLELARRCGIRHAVDASSGDVRSAVMDLTGGRGCELVVEASGNPAVAQSALELAGKLGQVVLLGSPRGQCEANVTELLNCIHLWPRGCVTLKGAHEWRYPVRHDPEGKCKHSIERNTEITFRLIADGRLRVRELLTHVLPPTACAEAYRGLREKRDEYVGVVFAWA